MSVKRKERGARMCCQANLLNLPERCCMLPWESVSRHLQSIPVSSQSISDHLLLQVWPWLGERRGGVERRHYISLNCMGWPKQPSQCCSRHLMSCSQYSRLISERTLGLSEETEENAGSGWGHWLSPASGGISAHSQRLRHLRCDDSKDAGMFPLCSLTSLTQINGNEISPL